MLPFQLQGSLVPKGPMVSVWEYFLRWVTCFPARRCSPASPTRNTTSWAGLAPVAQKSVGQLAFLSSSGV